MQVTVEELGALTRKMKIVLPQEYVAKHLNDAYEKLKTDVSVKGFRKGKVPRKILEKSHGDRVRSDVSEKMIQETYFDALEEVKLEAVVHPEIKTHNFEEDGTFAYEAEIDIKPDFELGKYKGVEVEQAEVVVSDDEIEGQIETIQKQMAPLRSVEDRAIAENDIVVIDFQGYHNGEPIKQVHGVDSSVDVGSGQLGREFEEVLIGLEKGEATKEIDFPDGFANPLLAGKKIEFKVTVKDVKERVLAKLDDEFAKDVGEEFNSMAELRDHIREDIRKKKEDSQQGDLADKIMLKLLEEHDFEVPAKLVIYEAEMLVKELEQNLKRQGLSLEATGMNRDALAGQYKDSAEKRVKGDFILKKIAEKEEIKLEEDDINQGFNRIAEKYGMPVEEIKKYFQKRDDLLPFMNELLSEKIVNFLRENADIKTVAPEDSEKKASDDQTPGENS